MRLRNLTNLRENDLLQKGTSAPYEERVMNATNLLLRGQDLCNIEILDALQHFALRI